MRISFLLAIIVLSIPAPVLADDLCLIAGKAMKEAKNIRGLEEKRVVPCLVQGKAAVRSYVLQAIDEGVAPGRLYAEGVVYKQLGLIPSSFEYETGIVELYTSQIGGYYDPKQRQFVMAQWIPATLQFPVAVHELVHALQDQHFELAQFLNPKTMSSDALMARAALVEGDATAVMMDYSLRRSGAGTIAQQENTNLFLAQNIIGTQMIGASSNAPQALLSLMVFPYTSGLRFAHHSIKDAGYEKLNRIFENPPRSTEEILHPDLYGTERADFIAPSVLLPQGHDELLRDTLGEFFLSVWLKSVGFRGEQAADIAAGWGGDTMLLSSEKETKQNHMQWHIRWDTAADMQEFEVVQEQVKKKLPDLSITCESQVCTLKGSVEK